MIVQICAMSSLLTFLFFAFNPGFSSSIFLVDHLPRLVK
jgi:hypothetical protein